MKRSPLEIKKEILKLLKEKPRSLRELETKVDTNYKTIIAQCEELEYFGYIKLIKYQKNKFNGKPYTVVELLQKEKF